jgi:hypothetical protein
LSDAPHGPRRRPAIQPWDWRYRAGFDRALAARVAALARSHAHGHARQQLLAQVDAFQGVLSLSALVQAVEDTPGQADAFLDAAEARLPLHVPRRLARRLEGRIARLAASPPAVRERLQALLQHAAWRRFDNPCGELAQAVFGRHAGRLLDARGDAPNKPLRAARVEAGSFDDDDARRIARLRAAWAASPLSAGLPMPAFTVRHEHRRGFGEYWPAELSDTGANVLALLSPPVQDVEEALRGTLVHELAGHATFYEFERAQPATLFDHGALGLVEGWATWCEWHAVDDAAAGRARAASIQALGWLREADPDAACDAIARHGRSLGYTAAAVDDAAEAFFQYPLMAASYTLGALWFEQRLDGAPADFFASLRGGPWGDFFDGW